MSERDEPLWIGQQEAGRPEDPKHKFYDAQGREVAVREVFAMEWSYMPREEPSES